MVPWQTPPLDWSYDHGKFMRLTTRSRPQYTAPMKKTTVDLTEGRFRKCFQSSIIFSMSSWSWLGNLLVPLPVAF